MLAKLGEVKQEAHNAYTEANTVNLKIAGLHSNFGTLSDSHGRYSVTNLSAGEYTVCALMPTDVQDAAPRVCLGGVFRRKDAETVKVGGRETEGGTDIEIPLSGMHKVAGNVSALPDGHVVGHGTLRLLYADDREKARETMLLEDGSYSFEYVPEGKYVLQVTGAQDVEHKESGDGQGEAEAATAKASPVRKYSDKEIAVTVLNDVDDMNLMLAAAAAASTGAPANAQKQ